jgi:hypothetical protein
LSTDLTFQELLQAQGKLEVKRQEIMWEMCETEQSFVKSMRTVLRLFAIPLKTPQGKWIDGIPPNITVLFDSLECVAHAHGIIAAAQRDMRRKSETLDTLAFTTMFRSWVSRLEVHEWYLLKFESVVQQVEDNVRDPASVFGEFVRMQMKDEVLGSMSLGSMLLKPVQRLTKYPLFLKVSKTPSGLADSSDYSTSRPILIPLNLSYCPYYLLRNPSSFDFKLPKRERKISNDYKLSNHVFMAYQKISR